VFVSSTGFSKKMSERIACAKTTVSRYAVLSCQLFRY
jgi:hypothetical protein